MLTLITDNQWHPCVMYQVVNGTHTIESDVDAMMENADEKVTNEDGCVMYQELEYRSDGKEVILNFDDFMMRVVDGIMQVIEESPAPKA